MRESVRIDGGYEAHLVGGPAEWLALQDRTARWRERLSVDDVRIAAEQYTERDGRPILFAGPWIGEFGWELARWQGGVRNLARRPGRRVIVMGDPGHDPLYEAADEYWTVPRFFHHPDLVRQCDHVRGDPGQAAPRIELLAYLVARELEAVGEVEAVVTPRRFKAAEQRVIPLRPSCEIWSDDMLSSCEAYFCVLPRLRRWNARKNWPVGNWHRLIAELRRPHFSCANVGDAETLGKMEPCFHFPEDLALARSIDLLSHAAFAIAPESGGALLSLLCGCPTLVFGSRAQQKRITRDENFLRTPVRYLARADYNFSVEEVADAARAFMRDLRIPA